jgi:hypothetical protein
MLADALGIWGFWTFINTPSLLVYINEVTKNGKVVVLLYWTVGLVALMYLYVPAQTHQLKRRVGMGVGVSYLLVTLAMILIGEIPPAEMLTLPDVCEHSGTGTAYIWDVYENCDRAFYLWQACEIHPDDVPDRCRTPEHFHAWRQKQ